MGKNDSSKQYSGDGTTTTMYSSGVDGIKEHIFDFGGYKDAANFSKTQNEFLNRILRSSEKGGSDVAKAIHDLKTASMTQIVPTNSENVLAGLKKDVWMDDHRTQKR